MTHAHIWQLDGRGLGICSFPECGEKRQFENAWSDAPRRFKRDIHQVIKEMNELYRQGHDLRPTRPGGNYYESRWRRRKE